MTSSSGNQRRWSYTIRSPMVTESDNPPVDPPADEAGTRSDAQSDVAPAVDPGAVSNALDAAFLPAKVAAECGFSD